MFVTMFKLCVRFSRVILFNDQRKLKWKEKENFG